MIDDSHYMVESTSSNNTYTVTAARSNWTCLCPDHAESKLEEMVSKGKLKKICYDIYVRSRSKNKKDGQ